ncbi:MAG: hypothetical protein QXE05_08115, partial [Nitrososphaeria archaeon]
IFNRIEEEARRRGCDVNTLFNEILKERLQEFFNPETRPKYMKPLYCILAGEAVKLGINPTEVRFQLEEDLGEKTDIRRRIPETACKDKDYQGPKMDHTTRKRTRIPKNKAMSLMLL